jgi:hypothetical protein
LRAWLIFGVLAGTLLWSAVAFADQPVSEQAKLYFGNGVELLQSSPPNYQDAYYQFKLAYQESKSWKVLGNLGLCALKLERDGEAFQYYTEYLQQGGNEIDPGERAALEREMLLITGNSATVSLTASAEGAELVVSRSGSSAPPQAYKFENSELGLRLRVGTHTLTATAPDGRRRTWDVSISPGQEAAHHFNFDSKEEPAGGARAGGGGESSRTRESGGALRTVGFVVTGVGAAALMGGAITGILAKNKESEATDGCYADVDANDQPIQRCPEGGEAALESADDLARTTNYLLIGGGVLAAAGITMIIFGGPVETTSARIEPPRRSLRLQPLVSPRAAGLFATGTF